jgi:hypothetical protein
MFRCSESFPFDENENSSNRQMWNPTTISVALFVLLSEPIFLERNGIKKMIHKLALQISAEMNSGGEYDAAFAATIAAAAHAIAAREEKLVTQKKPIPIEGVPPAPTPARRAESIKSPTGGRKISRWFSGKEPLEEDDNGPGKVNMTKFTPFSVTLSRAKPANLF